MGAYMATRSRGVFSADGNLAVAAGGGMTVTVSPGLAWLKRDDYWGVAVLQEDAATLALDRADGVQTRIDAIVCRLDKVANNAALTVKKGPLSAVPTPPAITHDSSTDEICLATVTVAAGCVSISAADITDQRLNETLCGLMRDGVTGIPTAALQEQAGALIARLKAVIAGIEQGSEVMLRAVYGGSSSGTVANADKLGGVSADGYATAAQVRQAQSAANAAVPKTGATMTGDLVATSANRSISGGCVRNAAVVSSGAVPTANLVSTNSLIFSRA